MLKKMMNVVRNEEGQGMAEYGLILAGVAIVAIVAFEALGGGISTLINEVIAEL